MHQLTSLGIALSPYARLDLDGSYRGRREETREVAMAKNCSYTVVMTMGGIEGAYARIPGKLSFFPYYAFEHCPKFSLLCLLKRAHYALIDVSYNSIIIIHLCVCLQKNYLLLYCMQHY